MGNLISAAAIMSGIAAVLGWWIQSRINNQSDRLLERFKDELAKQNILHTERLSAFKTLSEHLIALRRYCNACSAEFGQRSEFEPRRESLTAAENVSLLQHCQAIRRALEERELFVSADVREAFRQLFMQLNLGLHLELWLASGKDANELNAVQLYDLVATRVNEVLSAMFADLGFQPSTPQAKGLKGLLGFNSPAKADKP